MNLPHWLSMTPRRNPSYLEVHGDILLAAPRTKVMANAVAPYKSRGVFDPFLKIWRLRGLDANELSTLKNQLRAAKAVAIGMDEVEVLEGLNFSSIAGPKTFRYAFESYWINSPNPQVLYRDLVDLAAPFDGHPHIELTRFGCSVLCRRNDFHRALRAHLIRRGYRLQTKIFDSLSLPDLEHSACCALF